MQLEILALRHQLAVCRRSVKRPRLKPADRILWSWLARLWPGWRDALVIVQPRTVIAWQRRRFRDHWARLCRTGKPGRPQVAREVRVLIRRLSAANPLWGAPRIVGELRKIGIDVTKATVEKYMVRRRGPASPTWMTFLRTHAAEMISCDFFIVPTVTFQILYVFLILAHHRRRFTSMSPPTPRRSGPRSRSSRHSPTPTRRATSCAIATTSMAHFSTVASPVLESSKSRQHRGVRGRIRTSSV